MLYTMPESQRIEVMDDLERVFDQEWRDLSNTQKLCVFVDFTDPEDEPNLSAEEYKERIGEGNLKGYANVMASQLLRHHKNPEDK